MAFGLGKAADGGFAVDTIEEIREQAIELLTLPNMVSPLEDPVRSVLVERLTDKIYQLELVGLDVWNNMNIATASGANLDLLAQNIGIIRKTGIPQTITVQLISVNVGTGYSIPAGTQFTTTDGLYTYQNVAPIDVSSSDPMTASLQAVTNGDYSVVGGKLVSQTYIPQLSDIEITDITSAGSANETDEALRMRFWAKAMNYIGTIQFMLDKLSSISSLRQVGENHNNTATTDDDGVPAYSTEFLVLPHTGTDVEAVKQEVAQAILNFMLPGLPTYGSTSVTLQDYRGRNRTVNFTIPTTVPCEVYFQIGPKEDGTFSDMKSKEQVQAIYDYINGLGVGTDVSITALWGIVAPGAEFDILSFGVRRVGGEWQQGNLSIGSREVASIDLSHITIGVNSGAA